MCTWVRRLTALIAVVALAACTGSGDDAESTSVGEVKIGVLAPTSAAVGREALQGARLAADLVNEEQGVPLPLAAGAGLPGLDGANVTIVPADTKGDPELGARAATDLVTEERVAGLVGASDARVTFAASQRTERLGVPFVNGDTSTGYLTERGLDWFFRTGPNDRMFGEGFFSVLEEQGAPGGAARRVAIVYSNDKGGSDVAAVTEELATEGGYQAERIAFRAEAQDLAPAARLVRDTDPRAAFLIASSSDDAVKLVKAFRTIGYAPPGIMAFGPGFSDPAVLQATGQDGEGLLHSAAWSPELAARNPAAEAVATLYQEKFEAPMSSVAAGSFTAVLTLAKAIDDARSVDAQRVRSALIALDIPGRDTIMPWDGIRFDATRQNSQAAGVVQQVIERSLQVVFPTGLARREPVWPLTDARA
jgi:branched-chain amino acid transport system substrate-binding protein